MSEETKNTAPQPQKPETAEQRLANLLSEVMYEDSESV